MYRFNTDSRYKIQLKRLKNMEHETHRNVLINDYLI